MTFLVLLLIGAVVGIGSLAVEWISTTVMLDDEDDD
jgi:hypothetical protein